MEYGLYSGIHLRGIADGLVPFQEEHEARLEYRIGLEDWGRMEVFDKALIVAVRRNKLAMQNINAETEIRETKKQMRKR